LLAVLLSWIVVVLWSTYFGPKPTPTPELTPIEETIGEEVPERPAAQEPAAERSETSASLAEAGAEAGTEAVEVVEAANKELVSFETEDALISFTNEGAQLVSYRVKTQVDDAGEPMELVRRRQEGLLPFSLVDEAGEGLPLNDALFVVEENRGEAGAKILEFRYQGALGRATKRFQFGETGLFSYSVETDAAAGWGIFIGPGVANPSPVQLEQAQYWRGAVYMEGKDRERVDGRKASETTTVAPDSIRWMALDDQYFLAAVIPGRGTRSLHLKPYLLGAAGDEAALRPMPAKDLLTAEEKKEVRSLALIVEARGESLEGESYWGPKAYGELAKLPFGLQKAVNFGFFGFLARPLQIGLNFIHDRVVPNYGWAIILLTIGIRILILPLMYQSMRSSQKMQELNPKIQAIRGRYRSKLKDRQGRPNADAQRKMQEEIMGLYKSEGVNPASGCIPVFFQLPIFFAYYQLLGSAIELRHAPWIAWIQDLSVMDPHYVLPVIMFVTQFIQQYRMPMGGDPMQRRLMMLLPLVMFFFLLKFPAGLVLYWLTSNVFSIGQQEVYFALGRKKKEAAAA
jgi:YidC/Oxa1 family membrane protein insertase